MDPINVTLILALAVTLGFLVHGLFHFRRSADDESFFLFGHALTGSDHGVSFAAASVSLASVFAFFLAYGKPFGLAIAVAPLTYAIGAVAFRAVLIPRMKELGLFARGRRPLLHEVVARQFGSSAIGYSVLLMTLMGLVSILLIELFIGVELLSTFLQAPNGPPSAGLRDGLLVFLSAVVFAYAAFGGLAAVVATDRWQLYLMLVASFLTCGWLVWLFVEGTETLESSVLWGDGVPLAKGLLLPYPLLANMVVTNLLLLPSLLRTWQLVAASESPRAAIQGVNKGIAWTALLSSLLIAIALLSFHGPLTGR